MKVGARPVSLPIATPVAKVNSDAPAATAAKRVPLSPPSLSPPEGKPVTGAGELGWSTGRFWLEQTMLKPPFQTNIPLDDVEGGPLSPGVELPKLCDTDDREAVYAKLSKLPLDRLLVSPGYRYYRHPEQFGDVLQQVKANNRVDTRPSILDVHTDGHGNITNVDLRSHHLRMAAFIEVGRKTLGELPFDQLLIKVDGVQRDDKYWPMKAHGYAMPPEIFAKQGVHVVPDQQDPATVEIENLQNWDLGSRTSIKRFHETLLHRTQPKVGVVFGDGGKEGTEGGDLVAKALALKEKHGLDEVVIAPSGAPAAQLLERARTTDGVNLYLDAPGSLRETFPDLDYATLVKYRLNLLYGVDMHGIVE